jgi:hypothetical protein
MTWAWGAASGTVAGWSFVPYLRSIRRDPSVRPSPLSWLIQVRSLALSPVTATLCYETLDCGHRARSRLGAATAIDKRWFCRARYRES